MPPRRRARVDGAAAPPAAALASVLLLPHALLLAIFALLPVDARLRAAAVCRAWRQALADRALWTTLDFSGITCALTDALLRAAAARARGELRSLTLCEDDDLSHQALFEVARANADTLTELRGVEHDDTGEWQLAALLAAAPRLRVLQADVATHSARVLAMLSNQAPYDVLRLRRLTLRFGWRWISAPPEARLALATALGGHTSLERLSLMYPSPVVLAAVNDALDVMLANKLVGFELTFASWDESPVAAALSLFVRLLECETVTHLGLEGLDILAVRTTPAQTTPLWDALQANSTLTSLAITSLSRRPRDRWVESRLEPLLQAITSHAGLRRFDLAGFVSMDGRDAAALGALIAANAPALRELSPGQLRTRYEASDRCAATKHALARAALRAASRPRRERHRCALAAGARAARQHRLARAAAGG